MGGAGKRRRDRLAIAVMEIEPDIAGHVIVQPRRARRRRGGRLGHRGQRIDIDDDRLGRVLGLATVSATTTATGSPT